LTPEAADYLAKARRFERRPKNSLDRPSHGGGPIRLLRRISRGSRLHHRTYRENRKKSHSGVRSEFSRLAKETPRLDRTYSTILAKAYSYKEIGDYRVGQGATVSEAEASEAIVIRPLASLKA
jgi:hypothetical protein